MRSSKRVFQSKLLQRACHADVLELGPTPEWLCLFFGGSGIDRDEYERRGQSIIPLFDDLLSDLEQRSINLLFVHVTAPFDVPFNRFATQPDAAHLWNSHVVEELLQPWPQLQVAVCGFSGGAALAFNGLQEESRCFWAGAFGPDAIPSNFTCPTRWKQPLQIYTAPEDRVSNHPNNREVLSVLKSRGEAEIIDMCSGGHRLADYCTIEGLGDFLLRAPLSGESPA